MYTGSVASGGNIYDNKFKTLPPTPYKYIGGSICATSRYILLIYTYLLAGILYKPFVRICIIIFSARARAPNNTRARGLLYGVYSC